MDSEKTFLVNIIGEVQGVGMRYFIYQSAKKYGVKGYVKNMRDGTVEFVVQGKEDVLEHFLKYIKKASPGNIEQMNTEIENDHKTYRTFEITF